MRRRDFVSLLALGWLPGALAQRTRVWRIGVLVPRARPASIAGTSVGDFIRSMRELGYVEDKNVQYDLRFTEGKTEGLAEHVAELVRWKADVIVAGGTPPTRAAQKATSTIPIVTVNTGDPIGSGFVQSLARPGGNITGITNMNIDMNAKRVDLLRSAFPALKRIGALLNPANPTYALNLSTLQDAARKSGMTLAPVTAQRADEIAAAFSALKNAPVDALIVHTDSLFATNARQIAELALRTHIPLLGGAPEMVEQGGLMAYTPSLEWGYRRAAVYVDRILKGAKPADMPVEQPSKLELVINLKTAKALGITLPSDVTFRADKLIQ